MKRLEILVLQGASPASVAITYEVIGTANRIRERAGRGPCFGVATSGSGKDWALDLARLGSAAAGRGKAEIVIVPGLAWTDEARLRHGLKQADAETARARLRRAFASGAEIAASCSAVFLVASAGLLDERRATTTWWLAPLFREIFPAVRLETETMVVSDGRLTTAGAAMAQLDLMLSIVARHGDPDLADRCARFLLLDQRRSQARYMALSYLAQADDKVSRAERWARARLGTSLSVPDLAQAAGLGVRTFARRCERATGLSPVRLLQRLRVEKALELLETTRLTFDQIAERVGYAEPSTLRRLLHRETGASARGLRPG